VRMMRDMVDNLGKISFLLMSSLNAHSVFLSNQSLAPLDIWLSLQDGRDPKIGWSF